jgi:long-chain acyl-CoA synthetase
MSRLSEVLGSLAREPVVLEAFDRQGESAARLSGPEFAAATLAMRRRLESALPGEGARPLGLLFKPEESLEFLATALAALLEGRIVVPLFPNWSAETQRLYLETYKVESVAVGEGQADRVAEWAARDGRRLFVVNAGKALEEARASGLAGVTPPDVELDAERSVAWIFTSGTSGKVAKLTDVTVGNIDAAIRGIRSCDFLSSGMTVHDPLSISHIFAFACVLGVLASRPKRVLFSDVQYLARLPESRTGRVDAMILVPIVMNRMRAGFYEKLSQRLDPATCPRDLRPLARIPLALRLRLKRVVLAAEEAVGCLEARGRCGFRGSGSILLARAVFGRMIRRRLGSPRFVVVGGAKPSIPAMAFLETMGIRCLQGWGMTETTGPLAVCRLRDRFHGALGTAGDLFEESRAWIEDGELVVEGPQIARGYIEPDGRFLPFERRKRTGDRAEFDTRGRLRIVGKASDRINCENGLNYNPVNLEEALLAMDLEGPHLLEDVVVVGDGRPSLGALFVVRDGALAGRDAETAVGGLVRRFNDSRAVDERIGPWMISRLPLREAGFLGPTGKLRRAEVEAASGALWAGTGKEGETP